MQRWCYRFVVVTVSQLDRARYLGIGREGGEARTPRMTVTAHGLRKASIRITHNITGGGEPSNIEAGGTCWQRSSGTNRPVPAPFQKLTLCKYWHGHIPRLCRYPPYVRVDSPGFCCERQPTSLLRSQVKWHPCQTRGRKKA